MICEIVLTNTHTHTYTYPHVCNIILLMGRASEGGKGRMAGLCVGLVGLGRRSEIERERKSGREEEKERYSLKSVYYRLYSNQYT
jgi:hypothetical protein